MIPANLSIFREDYAPRSTRVVPTADGSASVYSALAVGRIVGQGRTIPALVCEEIGTEDKWHVINMYVAGGYVGTVAVLGATSGEQAGEWVGRQILPYLSGGQSSYCACDGVASAEALQAVLDSAATSVIRLPIRQKDIDTFEGRITDSPVVWDNDALQSHTAAELIHELAKHDREGQMMDAMCKDDLPKVVSQYDGIFELFDALIVDYNRLGLMQDRLFAAMHKANVGSVKPLTVTPTKPFKRNGVTNVAVLFEMDDGQTVTIIFHSPDATPAKLGPKDTLTSWKWLLNKRDVTVAVAPDNGENVQLPALARRILLLVEKNSARFKRTNSKKAEQMQDLADTTSRVEQKTAALDGLNAEIEGLQKKIDAGVKGGGQADQENWIGADRFFETVAPEEYGPAPRGDAIDFIMSAPEGTTALETIVRPSGRRVSFLLLSGGSGEYARDLVGLGNTLDHVKANLQKTLDDQMTRFSDQQQKLKGIQEYEKSVADRNGYRLNDLLGDIIPNTGKMLRSARIVADNDDGTFDVEGTAGNKRAIISNMQASRIERAIKRAADKKSAGITPEQAQKDDTQGDLLGGDQAPEEGLQKQIDAGGNDGRLTPDTAGNLKDGDVVKTADGTEYMAMGARHDWLEVAPIVNGKAQVNNQDTFKFLLTPEKASAYPERRTDPVYPTGRNYYADNESAKANMNTDKRPENWRTDKDAAISIASSMGIDTKGMQIKKIVTAIETKDRELRVDAAADLIDDVLADVKVPEGFGIVFDKMREIKNAYNGTRTMSGYIILQDVSGISKDSLSEVEVRIAVSSPGEREYATGYIFEMTGPNRGFPSKPSGSDGAFTADDSSIDGLRSMFADRLEKVFAFYAENDTQAAPTYAPEPDATAMTPKQYHEAKLAKIASDSGASMAEVRDNYDNEAERKANDSKWVEAVRQAAKEGKTISRATLDKMDEIRPGAVGSLMHDYPDADIPNGYQLPGARKTEAASKPNKKFDGYIKMAADSIDKLRGSDIDRVLDQAESRDEMLKLAVYMVERRPEIARGLVVGFDDLLKEKDWNRLVINPPSPPAAIPENAAEAIKHMRRLAKAYQPAGLAINVTEWDTAVVRTSVNSGSLGLAQANIELRRDSGKWTVSNIGRTDPRNGFDAEANDLLPVIAEWLNGKASVLKTSKMSEDPKWLGRGFATPWQDAINEAAGKAKAAPQQGATTMPTAAPAAPASNPDADLLNAIISGTTSAADVDMDALIAIAEKYDGNPEMEGLVNQALDVVTQYELEAAKAIG